ncbi:MAG: site-specific integrase [Thermoplasmata archaeon]|nr:site-specific integrase [Candidatus Sysuiplasma acidicola]MBX8645939.1 site-specific integrase [Candidatus Sysuiplasma acidicola]
MLKEYDKLPPHITREQYLRLLDAVARKYSSAGQWAKKERYLRDRDKLLLSLMWETGGRIGDILNIVPENFDFDRKVLNLSVKKRKNVNTIPLDDSLLLEISNYLRNYAVGGKLCDFSKVQAWKIVRTYGKETGIDVHPHMFRHGLAIHLLKNNVPIPIISARLGHSNVLTTMRYYLVITPEVQRQLVAGRI